jgi:hypothetical protein
MRRRRALDQVDPSGYVSGPTAATEATARALEKVGDARTILLVEGISDQIALETLALRRGRNLDADAVVILPMGGAHAITRFLTWFGPRDVRLAGLCDAGDEGTFKRGLAEANFGRAETRADMERLGFYICVEDLEDELVRAAGAERVETLFDSEGDLGSFRTLQMQPGWRDQSVEAQMRRFLGSGARRKLRYARLLVGSVELDHVPRPLDALLAAV